MRRCHGERLLGRAYRSISDSAKHAAYAKLAGPAIEALGVRILARGENVIAFGDGVQQRTVIVEFDNFKEAVAAYESDTYQKVLAILGDGAERDSRVVEGIV